MLGENLLVVVNIYPDGPQAKPVEIPKNVKWYSLNLDNETSTELPELKIRAGGIIPIQAPTQHSGEKPSYLGLIIALDDMGSASGIVYDDAGDGYEYTKGGYLLIAYTATLVDNSILITRDVEGNYKKLEELPLRITVLYKDKILTTTMSQQQNQIQIPLN